MLFCPQLAARAANWVHFLGKNKESWMKKVHSKEWTFGTCSIVLFYLRKAGAARAMPGRGDFIESIDLDFSQTLLIFKPKALLQVDLIPKAW